MSSRTEITGTWWICFWLSLIFLQLADGDIGKDLKRIADALEKSNNIMERRISDERIDKAYTR